MSALAQVIQINPEADLENRTLTHYEKAMALVITDQPSYTAAGELGKGLKALIAEITEYHEPLRVTAKANYDAVLKRKNDDLSPVTEAMEAVRKVMTVYLQDQERIRKTAELKAQAEAAEAARLEREKLERQAEKAIEKGKDEKADELLERAENLYVAPVTVAPTVAPLTRTSSGNIGQAKETKISVINVCDFLTELIAKNPAAVAGMVTIGAGPLKAFVKVNGIEKYAGLHIEKTLGVRL